MQPEKHKKRQNSITFHLIVHFLNNLYNENLTLVKKCTQKLSHYSRNKNVIKIVIRDYYISSSLSKGSKLFHCIQLPRSLTPNTINHRFSIH